MTAQGPVKNPGKFFIDGKWADPSTTSSIDVINSATEELFLTVAEAQEADLHRAVAAARKAFDQGPWPRMSHGERAKYMRAIAAEGRGLVIYEHQEGRGIGLMAKLRAYELQDSGLDTVDSHVCAMLANLAAAARLMGVATFVSGVSPLVALTLEQMGLSLAGVRTTLGLEEALGELFGPRVLGAITQGRSSRSLVEEALKRALVQAAPR